MTDTILLRALAALLIANSHLEAYYPIRSLAADGLLGDSLFFLLSGFGLALSRTRARRTFLDWYTRRIGRIYPALAVVVLVGDCLLAGGWSHWTARDYVLNFGWGRSYGFVGQIMTLYVLFYLAQRWERPNARLILTGLLFLPYALLPIVGRTDVSFHAFHWLYYFQLMLFGAWLAERPAPLAPGDGRALAAFFGLFAVYLAVRIAVNAGGHDRWFFAPHLLVFPLLVLLVRLARAERVGRFLAANRSVARLVSLVGGATLELYLVHYHVFPIPAIARLVFPLNVAVFLVVSVALACLLSEAVARLRTLAAWRAGRSLRIAAVSGNQ